MSRVDLVSLARWRRTNYRGRLVDLRSGPALTAALMAAAGLGSFFRPDGDRSAGQSNGLVSAGAVVAIGAAGAVGLIDDLCGDGSVRGFKGHLGELRRGRITTGAIKILGIGAGALGGAMLAGSARVPGRVNSGGRANLSGTANPTEGVNLRGLMNPAGLGNTIGRVNLPRRLLDAALIAASANLINLLDLRPGRALKAAAIPAVALCCGRNRAAAATAAAVIGAGSAAAPGDLAERTMLGDAGAGALGAALGFAASRQLKTPAAAAVLAGLTALTVASEKVSFSAVIARHPFLARLDALGRQS